MVPHTPLKFPEVLGAKFILSTFRKTGEASLMRATSLAYWNRKNVYPKKSLKKWVSYPVVQTKMLVLQNILAADDLPFGCGIVSSHT